jgi:hypothetical protein
MTDVDDQLTDLARDDSQTYAAGALVAVHGTSPSISITAKPKRFAKVPVTMVQEWPEAPVLAKDIDPVDLAREVEIFAECGQRAAIIARQLPDGVLEAVAGLHILAAARVHQELHTEAIVEVIVDLHVMSAEDPYRFATAEMEGGPAVSSLQRGLFYQRAVAALGSEAEVARVCKVHKSTVKRALDVARTVECINDKITIHNQVSQRQAEWFAQHVGFSSDFSDTEDPTTARRSHGSSTTARSCPRRRSSASCARR